MKHKPFWVPAAAALFILSCSDSGRLAGGGSSESGNAIVAGRITETGGTGLKGARVLLIDDENWLAKTLDGKSVILDSARTDGNGRFKMRFDLDRRMNLQVEGSEQGALFRDFHSKLDSGDNNVNLTASAYGKISGTLISDVGAVAGLYFPGTTYRARLSTAGGFTMDQLPQETYPTLVILQSDTQNVELPGSTIRVRSNTVSTQSMSVSPGKILLEDFSQAWPKSLLSRFTGEGGWHHVRDTVPPLFNKSILERTLVESPESFDGSSMKMVCVLDSLYAGIGYHLGGHSEPYDWSGLKTLSFQAKGKGKIRISVESLLLDSLGDDQFSRVIDIPSEWTRIEIPVDSLSLTKGSRGDSLGITWSRASTRIFRLEFVVKKNFTAPKDTTFFWMDDLAIDGVPMNRFLP